MDTYFQRVHGLPPELRRLIFEFATLRNELLGVRLRRHAPPVLSAFNAVFFRNWYYLFDRIDESDDGTYYIFGPDGRVRAMYTLH